jgi:RNA polymerase sigma factor (sigma-70 family)
MSSGRQSPLLQFIRAIRERGTEEATSDGDLLARFVATGDEAAFAALVRRHGPMVLSVCTRVLGDSDHAEDVFQETFLVLAQRAGSIRKLASVGSWLHGVASRLASKAKCRRDRIWTRERPFVNSAPVHAAAEPRGWDWSHELLDQEIQRLPQRYRLPIVLCYLQGKTHEEVARELGCPRETISANART